MDVVKEKSSKKKPRAVQLSAIGVLACVAVMGVATQSFDNQYTVKRESISTATVNAGGFDVTVTAPGYMVPRETYWISSDVDGLVDQIDLKPGTRVTEGQLILTLANPQLIRETEQLRWELEAAVSELAALKTDNDTQLLEMKAAVLKTQMEFERASNRYEAYTDLLEKGALSVSLIDLHDTELLTEMYRESLAIDKERLAQLTLNSQAKYAAMQAQVNRIRKMYDSKQSLVEKLNVTAPVTGVLQSLPLEIGQRVEIGTNMARLVKERDLIAQLHVPEHAVAPVKQGQSARIRTRSSEIEGVVSRIEPTVVDGTVIVEVELGGQLPDDARSDLSIDGEISVATRTNTLFVKRPSLSRENRTSSVYKVEPEREYASRVQVTFGIASATEIEVLWRGWAPTTK